MEITRIILSGGKQSVATLLFVETIYACIKREVKLA